MIFILTTLIEWIAFKMVADTSSDCKYSLMRYRIGWWSVVVIEIMMNFFALPPNVKVILLILISYIFYRVYYSTSWGNSFVVVGMFWLIVTGSDGLAVSFVNWMGDFTYAQYFMIILAKSLLIGIVLIYKKLGTSIRNRQREVSYIIIPILTNIIIILGIFGYLPHMGVNIKDYYGVLLSVVVLIFLANLSLITIIIKFTKEYEEKIELKSYQDRVKADYTYYTLLEKEHEQVIQYYHDMKNHIACIQGMMQERQPISQYIGTLEADLTPFQQVFHTGNTVVDTILRQKSILCKENHIDLKVGLELSKCTFIEEKDLCSIFANALDNAIEACELMKGVERPKYIYIEQSQIHQFLIIKIKNSKVNYIKTDHETILTHKKDPLLHGHGIKNIKRCVSKYEGEVAISYTENEFYLKIVLSI